MAVLLPRWAAYEKGSPRAGEADLIVAKHRNDRPKRPRWRSRATIRSSRILRRECSSEVHGSGGAKGRHFSAGFLCQRVMFIGERRSIVNAVCWNCGLGNPRGGFD